MEKEGWRPASEFPNMESFFVHVCFPVCAVCPPIVLVGSFFEVESTSDSDHNLPGAALRDPSRQHCKTLSYFPSIPMHPSERCATLVNDGLASGVRARRLTQREPQKRDRR